MMGPGRPPETYQQWLDCLQHLTAHPWDQDACRLTQQGRLTQPVPESFRVRVSDTVSAMLSSHCRKFLRQVDETLEAGDGDMIPMLAKRFWRNIPMCLFYRQLSFLDREFVRLLDEGYENQLRSFWKDFLRQLSRETRESDNPMLEELGPELKRIKIL